MRRGPFNSTVKAGLFALTTPMSFPKISTRHLHRFEKPRPEIVVANNAGLFATLAALKEHGVDRHPNLKVFCPSFWVDKADSRHDDIPWGQTYPGMPRIGREGLALLYPGLPEFARENPQTPITLGQYRELRNFVAWQLETEMKVPIIRGMPHIERNSSGGYDVTTGGQKLITPEDTFFYHWCRVNRQHGLGAEIPNRPHTELYTLREDEVPKVIIVLGAGLSTVWLARDFPDTTIVCLKSPGDTLPRTPLTEKQVDDSRIHVFNIDEVSITPLVAGGSQVAITGPGISAPISGEFFTAIGFKPAHLTGVVDRKNVLEIPESYDRFVADKIGPRGSLMDSYLMWLELTDNLDWALEPQAYHENTFQRFLQDYAEKSHLALPEGYFDELKAIITAQEYPVTETAAFKRFEEIFERRTTDREKVDAFKELMVKLKEGCHAEDRDDATLGFNPGLDKR